jgi:hypothetical protein
MGRYLDLVREPAATAVAETRVYDRNDLNDQRGPLVGFGRFGRFCRIPAQPPKPEPDACEDEAAEALVSPAAVPFASSPTATTKTTKAPRDKLPEGEEEWTAIVAYKRGIPHAWTEGFARVDPDRPPGDVPPRRWCQFVDDISRFLDSDFAPTAAALGWGSLDLFGCDRDRPFARLDQAGLLWLLNGDELIALSENTATIETRTGARQTWRHKRGEPGRVLAWELA